MTPPEFPRSETTHPETPARGGFRPTRRSVIALACAAALLRPGAAAALTTADAEAFVTKVVAELEALINSGASEAEQESRFSDMLMRYAAVPQITRFVMGLTWREMTDAQKAGVQDAFVGYVARVYVGLLDDYKGQTLTVVNSADFGKKGVLVTTRASGERVESAEVEWQVSDRGGSIQLVDLTAEGISMLQTQRQEFAAMLEKRNGDVDRFIEDLAELPKDD